MTTLDRVALGIAIFRREHPRASRFTAPNSLAKRVARYFPKSERPMIHGIATICAKEILPDTRFWEMSDEQARILSENICSKIR